MLNECDLPKRRALAWLGAITPTPSGPVLRPSFRLYCGRLSTEADLTSVGAGVAACQSFNIERLRASFNGSSDIAFTATDW